MPGSGGTGIFACRSAAAGAMSMRQTYLDLAAAAARSAASSCTWVEAMRASSPTRSRPGDTDVDELTAWMVSELFSTYLLPTLLPSLLATAASFSRCMAAAASSALAPGLCVLTFSLASLLVMIEQRKHPSALGKFEQIAAASKGKKIVMFLDYDGTLSPIVANPDAAYMSDAVSRRRTSFCVSNKKLNFLMPPGAGSHGMKFQDYVC